MTLTQVPAEQKRHKRELHGLIREAIQQKNGFIAFDEYMQMALYTPGLGYYSGSLAKFGAAGDFITAPEMGDLFAGCLAAQTAQILESLQGGVVLEFGAGSGALAAGLLNELDTLGVLPEQYLILELSGELRVRQKETIKSRAAEHFSRVRWLDTLPVNLCGVVVANEVLDAMPVKVFEQDASGKVMEMGVGYAEANDEQTPFRWLPGEAGAELNSAVQALNLVLDGNSYRSEIAFQAPAWIESLSEVLEQGAVLLIDYGFRQAEYYHPDRDQGTLMCHYQHRVHPDPFFEPGFQDITAHVDFTAVALAARRAGFDLAGYATQGAFLLSTGLLDRMALDGSTKAQLELAQQAKKLTMPHEMGELFKVLALTKNFTQPLCGFEQQNHLNRL
ncbi:MAG: SAM-dependent methyltransferase [Proteobacteria bacterium]|nr:SAM-dependent methyltransferase [Pseudomonadota bacterium]